MTRSPRSTRRRFHFEQRIPRGHLKGDVMRAADPGPSLGHARPLEERHRRAGRAPLVAEIQVVAAGIVEVHRPLDEAEPEHAGVEVDCPLRVVAANRDVMQPWMLMSAS